MWEHWQNNKPWETWFFQRGKDMRSFTGWCVSCCWVKKEMMQDKEKFLCQGATPCKTGVFLTGRVELFTGGWVSCCWVLKRDDAENEKNNYKTDERHRKRKYKYIVWCNLYIRKIFHSQLKAYKNSYKLLIMNRVSCSDEFFIKHLIS